jgi:hypothetical protein
MDHPKFEIANYMQFLCILDGIRRWFGELTIPVDNLTSSEIVGVVFHYLNLEKHEVAEIVAQIQADQLTQRQFRKLMKNKSSHRKLEQHRKDIKERITKYRGWMANPNLSQHNIENMRVDLQDLGEHHRDDLDETDLVWVDEVMEGLGRSDIADRIVQDLGIEFKS